MSGPDFPFRDDLAGSEVRTGCPVLLKTSCAAFPRHAVTEGDPIRLNVAASTRYPARLSHVLAL